MPPDPSSDSPRSPGLQGTPSSPITPAHPSASAYQDLSPSKASPLANAVSAVRAHTRQSATLYDFLGVEPSIDHTARMSFASVGLGLAAQPWPLFRMPMSSITRSQLTPVHRRYVEHMEGRSVMSSASVSNSDSGSGVSGSECIEELGASPHADPITASPRSRTSSAISFASAITYASSYFPWRSGHTRTTSETSVVSIRAAQISASHDNDLRKSTSYELPTELTAVVYSVLLDRESRRAYDTSLGLVSNAATNEPVQDDRTEVIDAESDLSGVLRLTVREGCPDIDTRIPAPVPPRPPRSNLRLSTISTRVSDNASSSNVSVTDEVAVENTAKGQGAAESVVSASDDDKPSTEESSDTNKSADGSVDADESLEIPRGGTAQSTPITPFFTAHGSAVTLPDQDQGSELVPDAPIHPSPVPSPRLDKGMSSEIVPLDKPYQPSPVPSSIPSTPPPRSTPRVSSTPSPGIKCGCTFTFTGNKVSVSKKACTYHTRTSSASNSPPAASKGQGRRSPPPTLTLAAPSQAAPNSAVTRPASIPPTFESWSSGTVDQEHACDLVGAGRYAQQRRSNIGPRTPVPKPARESESSDNSAEIPKIRSDAATSSTRSVVLTSPVSVTFGISRKTSVAFPALAASPSDVDEATSPVAPALETESSSDSEPVLPSPFANRHFLTMTPPGASQVGLTSARLSAVTPMSGTYGLAPPSAPPPSPAGGAQSIQNRPQTLPLSRGRSNTAASLPAGHPFLQPSAESIQTRRRDSVGPRGHRKAAPSISLSLIQIEEEQALRDAGNRYQGALGGHTGESVMSELQGLHGGQLRVPEGGRGPQVPCVHKTRDAQQNRYILHDDKMAGCLSFLHRPKKWPSKKTLRIGNPDPATFTHHAGHSNAHMAAAPIIHATQSHQGARAIDDHRTSESQSPWTQRNSTPLRPSKSKSKTRRDQLNLGVNVNTAQASWATKRAALDRELIVVQIYETQANDQASEASYTYQNRATNVTDIHLNTPTAGIHSSGETRFRRVLNRMPIDDVVVTSVINRSDHYFSSFTSDPDLATAMSLDSAVSIRLRGGSRLGTATQVAPTKRKAKWWQLLFPALVGKEQSGWHRTVSH